MNKIFLIGNLTRDPEMRSLPTGVTVCGFSIAVNRRFANAQGVKETDFFNVSAWRQLGDNCYKYLKKGSKCCVVGALQIRNYDASDGTKRMAVDVQADDVQFLDSAPRGEGGEYRPAPEKTEARVENGFSQIDDDELPF